MQSKHKRLAAALTASIVFGIMLLGYVVLLTIATRNATTRLLNTERVYDWLAVFFGTLFGVATALVLLYLAWRVVQQSWEAWKK